MKKQILFFTNLHPLPWQPTRATYNREEIRHLGEYADITLLIPVPWFIWVKEVLINGYRSEANMCLFPFFYIPKVLSFLHPLFLVLSVFISIKPLFLFSKANNVIASWSYAEGVCAALLKKIFQFKLVIECLGSDVNALMKKPAHKAQMRWAFDVANAVTTKSHALAKVVVEHAPRVAPKVVYNGVDFDTFSLRSLPVFERPDTHLVFIGSIIPTKGIFELLLGIAALEDRSRVKLSIIGAGNSSSSLSDNITSLGLQSTVTMKGAIEHSELVQHIQNADALILPSYREGIPNVIMESLATGTPVIATKVGGIPEVVEDRVNGILIEPESSTSVTTGILRAMQTKWYPQKIAHSIAHYSWQQTAQHIIKLLSDN
ncbi:glycosyltransferase [Alteromonas sp. CI.11.F.A3]|uniref:glycosyltransferase n=1 Tax=Alteromonas sp. CI.11.F.A3 TaxID=3079555 RepID=UPI002941ECFB|nr:glycosyltransferase [Alteromonas sp. CI.11.F.A3]WOI38744.1 glycosyltransferase [Alteromonas sp. CI.11.F.A3]